MKLISLETIAAMRKSADSYRQLVEQARKALKGEAAYATAVAGPAEAKVFDTIARELEQVADEKARERAISTTRWVTNANAGVRPVDARAIAAAIEATTAVSQVDTDDMLPGERGVHHRIRLVYYYDPTTKTKRWALEYTNDRDRPAISDNEHKEDAEYRYHDFLRKFGLKAN